MNKLIGAVIIVFFLIGCITRNETIGEGQFFRRGELSKDLWLDSMRNMFRSGNLKVLGQKPLRSLDSTEDHLRLIVSRPFVNPYMIYVNHKDSLTSVSYRIVPDGDRGKLGLSGFVLNYESRSSKMDSVYDKLKSKISKFDFYSGIDDADYGMADGEQFMIETFINGTYHVVYGTLPCYYRGCEQMVDILATVESLIPVGIAQSDVNHSRYKEDLLLPIYRR